MMNNSIEQLSQMIRNMLDLDNSNNRTELCNKILAAAFKTKNEEEIHAAINLIDRLVSLGITGEKAVEFFNGAHIIIHDSGSLFEEFSKLKLAQDRISSHFKDICQDQKGLTLGCFIPELLIQITVTKDALGNPVYRTHLQAERSAWRGLKGLNMNTAPHIIHTLMYALCAICSMLAGQTKQNLGPYGWSKHADDTPLTIEGPVFNNVSSTNLESTTSSRFSLRGC